MPHFRRLPDALVADVLGRLSLALTAGIPARRAWESEVARTPARWRPAVAAAAAAVAGGAGMAQALDAAGPAFGPLARGMAVVADHTGHDAEVLRDVAAALRHAVRTRRELRAALVKPALQCAAAVAAVGALIVISGGITGLDGRPVDLVGLGLRGPQGLRAYLVVLAVVAATVLVAVTMARRSWRAGGAVRRIAARLPVLGPALSAAEAAAWSRAAALASAVGIDAGGLVRVASSAAPGLSMSPEDVERRLRRGADLAAALAAAGRLPRRVVEAVGVGELTGTTPETLDRLAAGLEEEARTGLAAAVRVAGFAAWAAVAVLITLVVVRFFAMYAGLIQEAARPL